MKRQSKSYWCGLASIANALEVLGIRRSQREINRLCYVSPEEGCNEEEMKRALLANGVQVDEFIGTNAEGADDWLFNQVGNIGPAILCADQSEHWVTVIGFCSNRGAVRYLVFDPSRNQGVEVHSCESLVERWRDSDDGFYGIGLAL